MLASRLTLVAVATLPLLVVGGSVAAQDEAQPMTVAEANSDNVSRTVTIDGIALQPKFAPYDCQYIFSDGSGIIVIDPVSCDVPLLTPVNIVGRQRVVDEIEVTRWAELDGPMEDLGPREEAFMAWVALLGDDDMYDGDDGDDD